MNNIVEFECRLNSASFQGYINLEEYYKYVKDEEIDVAEECIFYYNRNMFEQHYLSSAYFKGEKEDIEELKYNYCTDGDFLKILLDYEDKEKIIQRNGYILAINCDLDYDFIEIYLNDGELESSINLYNRMLVERKMGFSDITKAEPYSERVDIDDRLISEDEAEEIAKEILEDKL